MPCEVGFRVGIWTQFTFCFSNYALCCAEHRPTLLLALTTVIGVKMMIFWDAPDAVYVILVPKVTLDGKSWHQCLIPVFMIFKTSYEGELELVRF